MTHVKLSSIVHVKSSFLALPYFVTLDSVLYISFNLNEFNLS